MLAPWLNAALRCVDAPAHDGVRKVTAQVVLLIDQQHPWQQAHHDDASGSASLARAGFGALGVTDTDSDSDAALA